MNEDTGWHLKKEIQVGHLFTTITVAVSAVMYINTIEKRVAILEELQHQQLQRDERQDKTSAESMALIRAQLEKIDTKLDRMLFGASLNRSGK